MVAAAGEAEGRVQAGPGGLWVPEREEGLVETAAGRSWRTEIGDVWSNTL